jgi:hypothetical protein
MGPSIAHRRTVVLPARGRLTVGTLGKKRKRRQGKEGEEVREKNKRERRKRRRNKKILNQKKKKKMDASIYNKQSDTKCILICVFNQSIRRGEIN